jgi:hypothetical protein
MEERGGTRSPFVNGYGSRYTPSPLQYPYTTHPTTAAGADVSDVKFSSNLNGDPVHRVANEAINSREEHQPILEKLQSTHIFVTRTPQSLNRDSQSSSTSEVAQSHAKSTKHRRVNSNSFKGKATEPKANSSIPPELTWPEFGRQCILAAENSRLNSFALHPAEYRLLRNHINHAQVTIYLNIRNAILRMWHRNPLVCVSPEEAAGCTRDRRYFGLANVAHLWLMRNGYINFGCVEVPDTSPRTRAKAERRTIVVVGAGMSGLGCARQMEGLFAQLGDELAGSKGERPPKIIILTPLSQPIGFYSTTWTSLHC